MIIRKKIKIIPSDKLYFKIHSNLIKEEKPKPKPKRRRWWPSESLGTASKDGKGWYKKGEKS